ncbi:MAG: hypothetical protein R2797_09520 [Gelidibacter sp.]
MHSNLLQQAFQKAQDTISSDKPTHLSRHLSDFIIEDSGEPFGEKSLRNYYKFIFEGKKVNLKPFVVQSLCHYLGYANYESYIVSIPKRKVERYKNGKSSLVSQMFTVIVVAFFFIVFLFSHSSKRKSMGEVLREWQGALEQHFYRMERLMRYLQGEAA